MSARLVKIPAVLPNHEANATDVLSFLHRGEGASIVFHAPDVTRLHGAVPVSRLSEMWHVIQPMVDAGACYFSINSCGRSYEAKNLPTGLFASRKEKDLKFLNAFFVDIDRHDEYPDVDLDLLRQRALELSDFLGLPSPTWTVKSGRGVWLLWLFSTPIVATPENRDHWQAVANSLVDSFTQLKPDRGSSTTINRIMRAPGSRNLDAAGARVEFTPVGQPCSFYNLARFLGVKPQPTPITRQDHEKRAKNQLKVRAARARWHKTRCGLEKLVQLRGTFSQGCRSWIVFYMAQAMKRAGMSDDHISRRCSYLGLNQCKPALDPDTINRKIASGKARPSRTKVVAGVPRLCYSGLEEIRRCFSVTPQELAQIPELLRKQKPQTKQQRIMGELFLILAETGESQEHKTGGWRRSVSNLLATLEDRGHKVSRRSLYRYLRQMDCANSVGRKSITTKTVLAESLTHVISRDSDKSAKREGGEDAKRKRPACNVP